MTYSTHTPQLPAQPLSLCSDVERKIGSRCWDLKAVQSAVSSNELSLNLSFTASEQIVSELNWTSSQVVGFFQALHLGRYNDSEWCLPPSYGNKFGPLAADSYVMGFDRMKLVESQLRVPWVYIKFSVREKSKQILIFSCHPTRF